MRGHPYWWTEGDLNPRLPLCESGDHTRLIYRPGIAYMKRLFAKRFRAFGEKHVLGFWRKSEVGNRFFGQCLAD
jgi:hypothetical protein